MEEELTLEKNLYNFIKEDELSFIQDPMNKKKRKLIRTEYNNSFYITDIEIHDIDALNELSAHNNKNILAILKSLKPIDRYMFFVIYCDWNFLIVLFYTSNDKKVFNRLNTYLSNKKSIVRFLFKKI